MQDWLKASVQPRIAGTYSTYRAAQDAAAELSRRGVPLDDVAVMAEGVRAVQDDGRPSWSGAAWQGVVAGVATAVALVVLGALDPGAAAGPSGALALLATLLLGALAGMAAAVAIRFVSGRLSAVDRPWSLHARRWSVLVSDRHTGRATALLARPKEQGRAVVPGPRRPSPSARQPLIRGADR